MGMTKDEKIARAIALRDAALIVVKRAGTWEAGSSQIKLLTARVGTLLIGYRTPFQRLPEAPEQMKYFAAQHGKPSLESWPYGLDVWAPKKVMCIEWDDQGNVLLVSLRHGEWEAELIEAGESTAA
jgi:hypothetical protein